MIITWLTCEDIISQIDCQTHVFSIYFLSGLDKIQVLLYIYNSYVLFAHLEFKPLALWRCAMNFGKLFAASTILGAATICLTGLFSSASAMEASLATDNELPYMQAQVITGNSNDTQCNNGYHRVHLGPNAQNQDVHPVAIQAIQAYSACLSELGADSNYVAVQRFYVETLDNGYPDVVWAAVGISGEDLPRILRLDVAEHAWAIHSETSWALPIDQAAMHLFDEGYSISRVADLYGALWLSDDFMLSGAFPTQFVEQGTVAAHLAQSERWAMDFTVQAHILGPHEFVVIRTREDGVRDAILVSGGPGEDFVISQAIPEYLLGMDVEDLEAYWVEYYLGQLARWRLGWDDGQRLLAEVFED